MSPRSDESVLRDKRLCSRGRAKVFLDHIQYPETSSRGRINREHVDHLISVFRSEGCIRLHTPEHYVPVVMSREDLTRSLRHSGLRIGHLTQDGEPPFLTVPEGTLITILHGEHRLRAATQFLEPTERWWVVEIYLSELQESTRQSIQEEYAYQLKFCDGDIYRNIRFYQKHDNKTQVEKWKARLSKGKSKYLKMLGNDANYDIRSGLDRLLPFTGLWDELELGALAHALYLRCPEEFGHYLDRVHRTWLLILEDHELFGLLDADTACSLETLTPESSQDAALVIDMMDRGELFPKIPETSVRGRIKDRILQVQGRILSLRTFLDDKNCIEAWVMSLRPLIEPIPPKTEITFRDALFHSFRPANHNKIPIQVSGGRFREFQGSTIDCKKLAYLMMFLVAMRNFPVLSGKSPRYKRGEQKPVVEGPLEEYQSHLARVATKLGFSNDKIRNLAGEDPELVGIRSFLRRIRPPELWDVDVCGFSVLTERIARDIERLATRRDRGTPPKFTQELGRVPKDRRCGLPDRTSYEADKDYLYIDDLYNFTPSGGSHLTSLAFQRDIFLSYFGTVPLSGVQSFSSAPEGEGPVEGSENNNLSNYELSTPSFDAPNAVGIPHEGLEPPPRRAMSSNYGTASDAHASRPATHLPDYGEFLNNPYMDDRYPRALGFEPMNSLNMNEFHELQTHEQISTVVEQCLSSNSVLVLYNWSTRQYAKFQDTPGDNLTFRTQTAELADKGYKFICFEDDGSISPLTLPNLWEDIKEKTLIFSGRDALDKWEKREFLESLNFI